MTSNSADDGGKRIKAVERTFRVIEVLRKEGPARISDVAETLDIPTSTAHVHLKTLEMVGYVVKDEDGFRLGLRFLRNGNLVRSRLPVYQIAKPEVDSLAEETGEVANLGVEEGGQRVILYQSEGSEAVYDNAPVGEYTNLHWTALGKAILSGLPHQYVDEILEQYGLPTQMPNTIKTRDELSDELQTIRQQGYALEDEERREGIRSVAVPLEPEQTLIGALSLSGPKERLDDNRIETELLPELKDRKNIIEVKYAYD